MPQGRDVSAADSDAGAMHASSSSSEFMKLYSPMADGAARQSQNGELASRFS